jgi:hypothetical protein
MSLLNPQPEDSPRGVPVAVAIGLAFLGCAVGALVTWAVLPPTTTTPSPGPVATASPVQPVEKSKPIESEKPSPAPETGDLEIEAALVYKIGGAQPVARTEFSLLDVSFDDVFAKARVGQAVEGLGSVDSYAFAFRHPESHPGYAYAIEAVLIRQVRYKAKTDFQGKTRFEKIPPGRYWIFGITETRGGGTPVGTSRWWSSPEAKRLFWTETMRPRPSDRTDEDPADHSTGFFVSSFCRTIWLCRPLRNSGPVASRPCLFGRVRDDSDQWG